MKPLTIRATDTEREELDSEYRRYGFDSRSEYLRHIIDHRAEIMEGAPRDQIEAQVEQLRDEMDELRETLMEIGASVLRNGVRHDTARVGGEPVADAGVGRGERQQGRERPSKRLEDLDLPGDPSVAERRREALAAMYDRLRELGEASKQELLEAVDDVEALGYGSPDYLWSNLVAGEDTLRVLPGVESPGSGYGAKWRYVGEVDADR